MKRVASAVAALGALTLLSTPVYARTTLADFRGGGESLERLLAHVHKHKKIKIVVKRPGDDTSTSTSSDTTATITPIGTGDSSIDPK
jgi:hypothetical protein